MTIDEVALENRLTRMEGAIHAGFEGVHTRLDTLNGQVKNNTGWRTDHEKAHAVEAAEDRAEATLRRGDWARITGLLGAAGVLSGIVFRVLEAT